MEEEGNTPCYSEEEAAAIRQEVWSLFGLWNMHVDECTDGTVVVGVHPPPAMMVLYPQLLEIGLPAESLHQMVPHDDDVLDLMSKITAYGDMMFRFGQFCMMRGVLYANMTPCPCGRVHDDELDKLLKEPPK